MLVPGDVSGYGTLVSRILDLSLQQCAEKCTSNQECNSFEFAEEHYLAGAGCFLNREQSKNNRQWLDQLFCIKLGKKH